MEELITTTEAALIAGVGVSSIKRWSDQELIQVIRTPGGHRRIVKADLIRFLRELAGPGVSPPADSEDRRAIQKSRQSIPLDVRARLSLSTLIGAQKSGIRTPRMSPAEPRDPHNVASFWADAMLHTDVYELQALLLHARGRLGSWSAASDEAASGLGEIGGRWAAGEVSVMEEHVASERLSRALSAILETMPSTGQEPVCLLVCATGEMHTLGLSFLQLCIKEGGWRPLWIGASTPLDELYAMAASGEVQAIAVSASEHASDPAQLQEFSELVGAACEASGTALLLGGSGAWPHRLLYGNRFWKFKAFAAHFKNLA